jgi:hypothetical protein
MNLPALDRALLSGRLARSAQARGTYDSKTDQTAQTDQRIEIADQFGAPHGLKPTSPHPKLTSGTAQRPQPEVQVVGASLDRARGHPRDAGLQP